MSVKAFLKRNFVLVIGLTLPVALMAGFMLASGIPQTLSDPPRYDLIFSTLDYSAGVNGVPVSVRLVVRDGVLKAQYTKTGPQPGGYVNNVWKKLYLYEAGSRQVRQLTFGYPADMDQIQGTREDSVEATRGLKLDTSLRSPDGYELSYDTRSRSGLLNEVFWGGGYASEPRLRKGSSSVRLIGDDRTYLYSGVEFVGWVVGKT